MPAPHPPTDRPPSRMLLRRADQPAVAGLILLALVAIAWKWVAWEGHRGRLVEIDREPPLRAAFQVDLNRAEWPELAQLPGIGETLARRIVEMRSSEGPFADNDDLLKVRGIGPRTLERLRPYLRSRPSGGAVAAK